MRKVNGLRARLIYDEYRSNECGMFVSDMIRRFFKNSPSYSEETVCSRKGCTSVVPGISYHLITLNCAEFDHNLPNIQSAILQKYCKEKKCLKCSHPVDEVKRTFGQHLFIEVI